jgi:hypothetical protein
MKIVNILWNFLILKIAFANDNIWVFERGGGKKGAKTKAILRIILLFTSSL